MKANIEEDDVFEIEQSTSPGLWERLPWWLILSVAGLVAELTNRPSMGVVVLCLKFGWSDFLTAFWLRRNDTDLAHGTTCFWFYVAAGMWRICLWSFLFFIVTLAAFGWFLEQRKQAQPAMKGQAHEFETELEACAGMWFTSAFIATSLTIFSTVRACRQNKKVWLSSSLSQSRTQAEWPPNPPQSRSNQLRQCLSLAGIALAVSVAVSGIVISIIGIGFVRAANGPFVNALAVCAFLLEMSCMLIAPFWILHVVDITNSRIGARTPQECWPEIAVSTDDRLAAPED